MKTVRKANERGKANFGWLDANYTFSFASYFDPKWMGFRSLRVINDDIIDEGMGFDTHPHRDMEIISFIIDGAMEHKDTLGNHSVIRPGEIQIMSAGTGILHSEYNPDKEHKTHSLQIWVEPNVKGISPRYDHYKFDKKDNDFTILVSPTGGKNIAKIHQDMTLSLGSFHKQDKNIELNESKHYWVHIFKGSALFGEEKLEAGDGLGLSEEGHLKISESENLEFLLFELS